MKRVFQFENRRIGRWTTIFLGGLTIMVACIGVLMLNISATVNAFRTGDVFGLMFEDSEIIREFWRDTVSVLWDELPISLILAVTALIIVLAIIVIGSGKERRIMARRRQELAKFKKTRTI